MKPIVSVVSVFHWSNSYSGVCVIRGKAFRGGCNFDGECIQAFPA